MLSFNGIPLFANLLPEDVAKFTDAAQIKSYKKGEFLYSAGECAEFFYIICSGWLKLFRITNEGKEIILAMLTKNSVTGENAIFEEGRFTSSAQVVEDAKIWVIPFSLLKEQLQANNQLALNMLASLVQYQRRHELQQEQYLFYSAPQRIGSFLLDFCPEPEQKNGVIVILPYDKMLIASMLGMKKATFSRALNILRDETGIEIKGARVKIDSMKRLLKFVDGCHLRPNSDKN